MRAIGAAMQAAYTEAGLLAMTRDIGFETLIRPLSAHYQREVIHQERVT